MCESKSITNRQVYKCKNSNMCPESALAERALYCVDTQDVETAVIQCYDSFAREVYTYYYNTEIDKR